MTEITFKKIVLDDESFKKFQMSEQQFHALTSNQKLVVIDELIKIHSSRIITDDHITGKLSGSKK